MDDDYTTPTRAGAPLIQAALALLVACTLVAFSALAFRMGFAEERGRGVTATDAGGAGGAVVLPALGGVERPSEGAQPNNERARVAITASTDQPVVLGTRVDASTASHARDADRHDNRRGAGHDKARGRGHHKDHDKNKHKDDRDDRDGRSTAAREEEDDDHDHGDDDSDDSEDSESRSRRSRRSGKRHHGSGDHSRGHSRGSNSN